MSRYIDVNMLIKKYIDTDIKKFSNSDVKIVLENLKQNILKAPSIEIVRCKECKHRINDDDFQEKHICLLRRANGGKFCRDNDFCSYGQKGDENVETD